MQDENIIIKAIYETKRQNLILAFKNESIQDFIEPALVFAYENRMVPYFHNDFEQNADPFESAYHIKKDFVNTVIKFADTIWTSKEKENLSFYQYEDEFHRTNRHELICIFRYAYLSHRFDKQFFQDLLKNHGAPTEANSIADEFNPNQIYL